MFEFIRRWINPQSKMLLGASYICTSCKFRSIERKDICLTCGASFKRQEEALGRPINSADQSLKHHESISRVQPNFSS